ncbi:Ankyrin [Plasmopara halstedii]|uniref:Ankyrin n=1 Tax=Plasmopara halstedii TaxID=4781 RepID=A0A0P1B4S9_PLAHL|nr:Ankyrin [Plasmopara halstedii]CEG49159.1 Ankyrin [Plasmopara halstedii]|eukprot:XP_024585528.1 Ankyrin [Plasmopara halstedii]
MQLQLVSSEAFNVVPSPQAKLRPMRDFEAANGMLPASRRAELSRRRHCVDFDHECLELCQAFHTAPEPLAFESLPCNSSPTSILRTRSTSASVPVNMLPRTLELSTVRSEHSKEKHFKAKKKVSFLQMEPEQEFEHSLQKPCSCTCLKPIEIVKETPPSIHAICRRADRQALKHLLSFYSGANLIQLVNSSCTCGRTPLEVACEAGDINIVKLLLKRHADPNSAGNTVAGGNLTLSNHIRNHRRRSIDNIHKQKQRTCLGIASKSRKSDIMELLMQYGARIDEEAVVIAARHGHEDVIRTLVKFANADAKKKANPVHQLFHKKGAVVTERIYVPLISSSLLLKACSAAAMANSKLIYILLGEGKTAISKQNVIQCALDAIYVLDYRLVKCLTTMYDSRLLIDACDKMSKSSLLHAAVKIGSAEIALLLIELGADVHAKDGSGVPPLYLACARGQEFVVRTLIEKGAKCAAVGPSGETPLHIAAQENQLACVKLLLDVGNVHVDEVTHDRCTALHLASQRGNTAVAEYLLDHGADVDAMTVNNESPLLKASRMSQFETVKLLLSRNARTKPGLTSSTSEQQLAVTGGMSSSLNLQDSDARVFRRRSWSSSDTSTQRKGSKENESILIAKPSTHTSLKHWLRSVLHN